MTLTNENQPYVLANTNNHVLWLSMNRPQERNPLSSAMLRALYAHISEASENDDIRVIVITGEGGVFSAGHDLKEMSGRKENCEPDNAKRVKGVLDDCRQLMMSLVKSPKAIIACVQGTASAAGCQLVSMCDLAVTQEQAKFCAPGVNIGTFCTTPLVGIGRNMHRKHAMEIALTGDMFSAEDALRFGLVNKVVTIEDLKDETEKLANKIAQKSAVGIHSGKLAFYQQIEETLESAYISASHAMLHAMLSDECEEGVSAFFDKRAPQWQGL
ncbi:enoyl-CoA hydratase [Colwellia psychrerythraea]|uniref:Enoyl-CoA hydratase domain-containing protein 3, mitochondrial n=1 Tax=Colwellia psychrerythraea TaxID=28229 RepID=A0A099KB71_COLPS|nr:enoyl-CoA hydratase [Colwellia psychrerythraea]KGJ87561.1 Enoyl-CoA hydratase/isomerase [Colwellia psychrerythraea]